jgi:hypothetical protein
MVVTKLDGLNYIGNQSDIGIRMVLLHVIPGWYVPQYMYSY